MKDEVIVATRGLTMAYGSHVIQQDLDVEIRRGDVFVIMGPSGCGKSTLLRHLIGLKRPAAGQVLVRGESFYEVDADRRQALQRDFGVLFQGGALWTSMSLTENVALPLEVHTQLSPARAREVARFKLALVGLGGFEDYRPGEISGGMRRRAGLARALALDPALLFLDEPSAGLDPLSARRLDELILELREGLGTTVVIVTHELASIMAIADDSVFLDPETRTALAQGDPRELLRSGPPGVRSFLARGEAEASGPASDGDQEQPETSA